MTKDRMRDAATTEIIAALLRHRWRIEAIRDGAAATPDSLAAAQSAAGRCVVELQRRELPVELYEELEIPYMKRSHE